MSPTVQDPEQHEPDLEPSPDGMPPEDEDGEESEDPTDLPPFHRDESAIEQRRPQDLTVAEADSLPVLEAFQEFIEAERRRSRDRLIALSVFFTTLTVLVVVGGLVVAMIMVQPLRDNFRLVATQLDSYRQEAIRARVQTESAVTRFAAETSELRRGVARTEVQTLAAARSQLADQARSYDTKLAGIRELVGAMEQENERLKRDIGSMKSELPVMIARQAPEPAPALKPQPAALTRARPQAPPVPVVSTPPAPRSVALRIGPPGSDRPVTWRMPIPE